MMHQSKHWAIVGGGMMGMSLALRLARQGQRVTLFEAADHLGGVADAWTLGGVTWDRHYHVIAPSDQYLRALLAELRLERDIDWTQTKTGFHVDGKLYSISNTLEFLRFPPLGILDKLRLALTIFYASRLRSVKRLETIPVARWLRRWSGRRTFEKMWLPLLRAKLGDRYEITSAAFIATTIRRLYAARRTGAKKETFGYVPGGYARILDRLGKRLAAKNVDVQLGRAVRRVVEEADGRLAVECADARRDVFDRVVLTAPSPLIPRLCPDLTPEEKQRHQRIKYQGIICASLLLKKPLAGYYVTNITDNWVPFTGVVESTALVDRRHFGGRTLVYLPKYVSPDDPYFALSDDELRTQFLTAFERMYPDFRLDDVLAFRVSRVRQLMAVPTLGYSSQLPPVKTSIAGLYVVNSAQITDGTLNVNETIRVADDALQQVLSPASPPEHNNLVERREHVTAAC